VKKTRQNLKPFAGVGVAHRGCEEAKAEGQHDDIQHEVLLVVVVSKRRLWVLQGTRIALDQHGIAAGNPGFARSSGREVPLAAYVFEAGAQAIL
jgi:hypothetical protein